ncbi:response regulator [Nubsella zeaxanthinifaciens]|jgi:CheY-like chemotaxis protein/signal transduction histidine kinase/CHASE3 domain sensor protein|uniref:response regulator n=1 Tax=Nubsella zeaxanthinifaciens TaxID=392412 RepID=UPI000DE1CEB9|nr:response regulator [Nubsella zeaxanthinifaciens]
MLKLSFKQQLLTGFTASLIFVLISAVASYLSIHSLNDSYNWVSHTQNVAKTAERLEIKLLHSEASLRGFLLSENDDYRGPYDENINSILPLVEDLNNLVSDNPQQQRKADSIKVYAVWKVSDMKQIAAKANIGDFTAAKKQFLNDKGRINKIKFLAFADDLIALEYKLLKERQEVSANKSTRTIAVIVISSLIIFGLILFMLKYIRATFDQQKATEKEILLTNKELADLSAKNEHHNWLLSSEAKINEVMRGEFTMDQLAENVITAICNLLNYPIGVFYLINRSQKTLRVRGAFAIHENLSDRAYHFGEGLAGQAALEKKTKIFTPVPDGYLKISSALGNVTPSSIICVPVLFEDTAIAVLEIGLTNEPLPNDIAFLELVAKDIGIAVNSMVAKVKLQELFEKTQQQAEELISQQEELRVTNEDLMHKTEELQASEEELRVQQEELQQANAELEEKAQLLEEKNASINQAKEAISLKAEELSLSSRYKSEFLANMSHELRTPLNSILILARILKENKLNNLSEEQIKYAGVIHNAGSDLLALINDILDLSKIESGKVDLVIEEVNPTAIKSQIDSLFSELTKQKEINYQFTLKNDLPSYITTDQARIEQIIKNLLSNAIKFTRKGGSVTVEVGLANQQQVKYNQTLKQQEKLIYFAVNDTGIGIPQEKQQIIFEAFQQEDGSTSRKYGGTGLGLSISRELANLLGGEIQLSSEVGIGSTFTLIIPQSLVASIETPENSNPKVAETIQPEFVEAPSITLPVAPKNSAGNKLLIVEDDENFAEILKAYAIEKGFEPILAHSGDEGLALAIEELPDAIVLDVMLPVMDGWTILKKLKANPATQHIPIHMMSAGDEKTSKAKKEGAIGFLKKPVDKEKLDQAFELLSNQYTYHFNNVLVIEDQILQSNDLNEQLIKKGAKVSQAYTGKEALQMLEESTFDCIILDLKLPDISGFDLLDQIKSNPDTKHIPVIINTAMELDRDKMAQIMRYSQAMVLKSNKSNDRLLDEVSLFMNKLQVDTPKEESVRLTAAPKNYAPTIEKALENKTILITDDDMRNIFALSSALQDYKINVLIANNGVEALNKLSEHTEIDLVLMDIMMPEMDGYEAMRKIRAQRHLANLPVIALTAKAMKNDREKCIEAGASDYISKPVDVDKLLSMLRVWLS